MLEYDPKKRLTPQSAVNHAFLLKPSSGSETDRRHRSQSVASVNRLPLYQQSSEPSYANSHHNSDAPDTTTQQMVLNNFFPNFLHTSFIFFAFLVDRSGSRISTDLNHGNGSYFILRVQRCSGNVTLFQHRRFPSLL